MYKQGGHRLEALAEQTISGRLLATISEYSFRAECGVSVSSSYLIVLLLLQWKLMYSLLSTVKMSLRKYYLVVTVSHSEIHQAIRISRRRYSRSPYLQAIQLSCVTNSSSRDQMWSPHLQSFLSLVTRNHFTDNGICQKLSVRNVSSWHIEHRHSSRV